MAESPFAFFRGGAAIMAADLAPTATTGLRVQACGDAHVANFGKFATPERNVVFDINDFDETVPGPWEWDVKRLAASLHVVARGHGFSDEVCDRVVVTAAREYRERLAEFASMRTMELWYDRIHIDDVLAHFPPPYRTIVRRDVRKAERKNRVPGRGQADDVGRRRAPLRRGPTVPRPHQRHRPRHGRGRRR